MNSSSPSDPDLAFIIPARNEDRYIVAAIESIHQQTIPLQRLEVVIVENGSSDDTLGVARHALKQLPLLRGEVLSQEEASIPGSKNQGARHAHAAVLVFLDADSRAAPDLAECVLAWVARGYPAGSIRIVADSRDWLDRAFFSLIDWGKGLFGIHANMLYCRRDLFLASGGFGEDIRLAEDLEFMVRLKRQGVAICHVSDSCIATSPRRFHDLPLRLGLIRTFARWALAHIGIGRRWRY